MDWSVLGFIMAVFFMAFLNGGAAFVVRIAVYEGKRIEAQAHGKIVVSRRFLDDVNTALTRYQDSALAVKESFSYSYSSEARRIADEYGGSQIAIEEKLRDAVSAHGTGDLIAKDELSSLDSFASAGTISNMLGSAVLLWWAVMLVFQGEGLELDLQRRRHPMWEWLFSHPVPPGAIFFAEMLTPIAANPIYWSAPLFAGFLYGFVYDPALGMAAAVLIGVPITIAAACLGKALEIGVILRFPARSRGAMIGLMSWMGYASMMAFLLGMFVIPKIVTVLGRFLGLLTAVPWPWLRLFLGVGQDGSLSFLRGMFTCWFVAAVTVAGAVWFSVWGTQRGLTGNFAPADSGPAVSKKGGRSFGKEPLYRKEFLWFIRDRSAIVQTILIPLTVAGVQVFNLRGILSYAQGAWNYLCGVAILFGTYFL